MPESNDRAFDARLAEYISAREEMLTSISNQHLALTFGTASLVGGFVAGVAAWDKAIAPAVFLALAPLSWWVLLMWMGEVVRMLRSVAFCADRAQDINALVPDDPEAIRWETWRRASDRRTISWTYGSVLVMVAVTNAAAIAGAVVSSHSGAHWSDVALGVSLALTVCAGLMVAGFVLTTYRAWSAKGLGEGIGMPPSSVFSKLTQ